VSVLCYAPEWWVKFDRLFLNGLIANPILCASFHLDSSRFSSLNSPPTKAFSRATYL
jgi:hypothetical protein